MSRENSGLPDELNKFLDRRIPIGVQSQRKKIQSVAPPPRMLDLFCPTSKLHVAIPYFHLLRVDCSANTVLTLYGSRWRVEIHGRDLEKLYRLLIEHKISKIAEDPARYRDTSHKSWAVERIVVVDEDS